MTPHIQMDELDSKHKQWKIDRVERKIHKHMLKPMNRNDEWLVANDERSLLIPLSDHQVLITMC
jgi:hypothetical protein